MNAPRFRFLLTLQLGLLGLGLLSCNATERLIRSALSEGAMVQEGEWTYWYESGQMSAQGRYSGDHQVGPWTYWYENGAVEWKGVFGETRIHGPSTFYYENGRKRAEGWFVDGFEDGRWRLWTAEGNLEQAGIFLKGRAELRWTYYHDDGSRLAEGYKHRGEKVGLWRFWDEDGTLYETTYPMPEGLRIVSETWDDGTLRREGFVDHDGPVGRWLTWHSDGSCRSSGVFENGRPDGRWFFWAPGGDLLAAGHMRKGRFTGSWSLWDSGTGSTASGASFPRPDAPVASWSADTMAENHDVGVVLATWVAEACAPITEALEQRPAEGVAPPPPHLTAATDREPRVRLRRQPWTQSDRQSFDDLLARYTEGEAEARPPVGSRYARRREAQRARPAARSTGDTARSEALLGRRLPVTRFRTGDGEWLDLADHTGERNVCLVVLRGFAREVCVHGVTQTAALARSAHELDALNTEVYVLYPGERNRLGAFLEAFGDVAAFEGGLPIQLLHDPDFALVEGLGIASELAIPTTLILDTTGVIRFAYVGETIEDRPPVKDLLEVITGFGAP